MTDPLSEWLDELERKARAATPGKRESWRDGNQYLNADQKQLVGASIVKGLPRAWNPWAIVKDDPNVTRLKDQDADYLAALPPETVQALVDCVRAAQARANCDTDSPTRLRDALAHLRRLVEGDA